MTQQTDNNDQTSASGDRGADGRAPHAANKRAEQLRGGLEKAVSGRESVIKAQALKFAEQLDERTQGRHHNKIRVVLKAVEFIVDNAARKRDGDTNRASRNDPDNLGEFRNVNDVGRSS